MKKYVLTMLVLAGMTASFVSMAQAGDTYVVKHPLSLSTGAIVVDYTARGAQYIKDVILYNGTTTTVMLEVNVASATIRRVVLGPNSDKTLVFNDWANNFGVNVASMNPVNAGITYTLDGGAFMPGVTLTNIGCSVRFSR